MSAPYRIPRQTITWKSYHASPGTDWKLVFKVAVQGLRAGWKVDAFDAARCHITGQRAAQVRCPICADWASHEPADRRFNGHHARCKHGRGQW